MIELAEIEPGAQKRIMVGGMRIGNYLFKLRFMPFQGANSGSFLGPFWAPFWVHFLGPLRGPILAKTQGKQMVLELSCPPKRLGFGSLFGFNFGYISDSISGRLPWGRFSEAQPEESNIIFLIELAQQPRAQKKVIRPYYLIQNY